MAELGLIPARSPAIGKTISADSLIRGVLLGAVLLAMWLSFRPFESLADATEVSEAGNVVNQVGYSLLLILLGAWCLAHQPGRLALLVRPVLVAALLWFALTVVTSWEPVLSARRLALSLVVIGLAAMALLLPKNLRHFADILAITVTIVLVLCYFGVFFAPQVSIHQSTDFGEPELAGDWRGVFEHKNGASAAMVAFIFIALFIARMRGAMLGFVIGALAFVFLLFTHSRTSIVTLPLVLIVSWLMPRLRPAVGVAFALSIVVVLNTFSVGSLFFEPVRNLLDMILKDSSFTGRNEVWQFAVERMMQRPITGYGFAAFWGTPQVVFGGGGENEWATSAAHGHNSYLDLILTMGIPGAILATLWLVVLPLVDFYRAPRGAYDAPLAMLFLRICLFAAYSSCFEDRLLGEGAGAFLLFAAIFGLRFLSKTAVMA